MKSRISYLLLVILFGYAALFTRSGAELPRLVVIYGGDTLWAVMCYFLICAILPKFWGRTNFVLALLLSVSVETFQLYQAPWVMDIRATYLGGLLLGHGFKLSDLVCYFIGNSAGFLMDKAGRGFTAAFLVSKTQESVRF